MTSAGYTPHYDLTKDTPNRYSLTGKLWNVFGGGGGGGKDHVYQQVWLYYEMEIFMLMMINIWVMGAFQKHLWALKSKSS